jgi:hypothetical protein
LDLRRIDLLRGIRLRQRRLVGAIQMIDVELRFGGDRIVSAADLEAAAAQVQSLQNVVAPGDDVNRALLSV